MGNGRGRGIGWIVAVLIGAGVLPWLLRRAEDGHRRVVVYCAHDALFADQVLKQFEQSTGIRVDVRYDEEANKSLGLTNLLLAERARPRCDVFWNNQTLGTIRLKREGVLAPSDASAFHRIPDKYKDPDGCWCGFSARLRVWIINTERMPATEEAIAEALKADSLTNVAIAVPLFGTTLTHYTELCEQLGLDGLKEWHNSLHSRGIREARGNAAVRDLVAEGACDLGMTDTDDAFAALDAGKPVAMLPIHLPSGESISIPNSVAMIRNCPHPDEAAELIRFLLSADTELALAKSAARQVPLGPVDASQLPQEVRDLVNEVENGAPVNRAADCDADVLNWLQSERQ